MISSGDDSVATQPQPQFSVCAVRANVTSDLRLGPSGWQLGNDNCGVGSHHTDHFQNPTLFRPQLEGQRFRTTLLRDHGQWFVMEVCEPLETLVDLSAPFYGYEGPRDTLTIITDSEKDPVLMGFKLLGDEEVPLFEDVAHQEVDIDAAPEDEVLGQEIAFETAEGAGVGAEVPLGGRIVMSAAPTDQMLVNGAEPTADSSLRALRAALTHYGLTTSGPKAKCFNRLLNHQKQLEFQVLHGAAEQAQGRTPKSVPLQIPPDEETQQKHFLTHIPYQPWCSSCVCFRARADQHQRTGALRRGGVATISFDFAYTKAVPESKDAKEVDSCGFNDQFGHGGFINWICSCSRLAQQE